MLSFIMAFSLHQTAFPDHTIKLFGDTGEQGRRPFRRNLPAACWS
ncbi:hypothetical protein ESA_03019 [Cronobacter sakazakii ATCC BAA-894]|uniref:Uncharacterized protein n=1 Tax=Cronobacter sakazakii (strain ATCC BAA-894) TaxID=290339 RepID=A7MN33_CROS8|nr:hypothetical protein ESA_03019 [Cronobacter sakazakii ATCC BAA-894]